MKKIFFFLLIVLTLVSCRRLYVNHKSPSQKNWWVGEYYMLRGSSGVSTKDRKLIMNDKDFSVTIYNEDSSSTENFKITSTSSSKVISKQSRLTRIEGKNYKTDITVTITPHLYQQLEERWIIPKMSPESILNWENQLVRIK
jgi:uncharacterized protein YcfL